MPPLTGTKPSETYPFLLKVNGGVDGTLKTVNDGLGNDTALQVSTTEAKVAGNLTALGLVLADSNAGVGTLQGLYTNSANTGAPMGFRMGVPGGWCIGFRTNPGNGWFEITDSGGGIQHRWTDKRYILSSDGAVGFSSESSFATAGAGAVDAALKRIGSGSLEINNGTAGSYRDLTARQFLFSDALQSTPSGGNSRGTGATDLQTSRVDNNQVAYGDNSFVVGANSAAYGTGAVAAGVTAFATNVGSVAIGTNSICAGASSIAIGNAARSGRTFSCTISGTTVTVAGQGASLSSLTTGLASLAFTSLNATVGGLTTAVRRLVSASNVSGNLVLTIDAALGSATTGTVWLQASSNIALGISATASGSDAIALSRGTASGSSSFAAFGATASGNNSVAFGNSVTASAGNSFAFMANVTGFGSVGFGVPVGGSYSFGCGSSNTVTGSYSIASGAGNTVSGGFSTVSGASNTVSGSYSSAKGSSNTVSGNAAHAEGSSNNASGNSVHVEGISNSVFGDSSHVEGYGNTVYGQYAHVEGFTNFVSSDSPYSHVEGYANSMTGANTSSIAGLNNQIYYSTYSNVSGGASRAGDGTGNYGATALGVNALSTSNGSFASGLGDRVFSVDNVSSFTHGDISNYAIRSTGPAAFAHGYVGFTSDVYVVSRPYISSSGYGSVAFGSVFNPTVDGQYAAIAASGHGSFAAGATEGAGVISSVGQGSVAMGYADSQILSAGTGSIALGYNAVASAGGAVSIGVGSSANAENSIALGSSNTAGGNLAIAIGVANNSGINNTVTIGTSNYAGGSFDITGGYNNQSYGGNCIVLGSSNLAYGAGSSVIGNNNSVSATYGSAIGTGNSVSGSGYGIAVGYSSTVNAGAYGVAVGFNAIASTNYNVALGYYSRAMRAGEISLPTYAANVGKASLYGTILYAQTTDTTPTALANAMGGTAIPLVSGHGTLFEIPVLGVRSGGVAEAASFLITGCVQKTGAGTAGFVGTPTVTVIGRNSASLDASVSLSSNNLVITVTGLASQTWRWTANPRFTEMYAP